MYWCYLIDAKNRAAGDGEGESGVPLKRRAPHFGPALVRSGRSRFRLVNNQLIQSHGARGESCSYKWNGGRSQVPSFYIGTAYLDPNEHTIGTRYWYDQFCRYRWRIFVLPTVLGQAQPHFLLLIVSIVGKLTQKR